MELRDCLRNFYSFFVSKTFSFYRDTNNIVAIKCERDTVLLKIVSAMLFVLICMYVILPLFELINVTDSQSKPFPYKMIFPYDAYNTFTYVITYFLTSLAGFGVVTTLFSEDSLFGFFVAYTCGQFTILHNKIDNIIDQGNINSTKKAIKLAAQYDRQVTSKLQLKQIIDHHNKIIKYNNQFVRSKDILLTN